MLVKITQDELASLMGGLAQDINLKGNPSIILIAGLQGSGKTTFSGKLANFLKTKKRAFGNPCCRRRLQTRCN
jgi:signal recognition particle subunit SRP54